MSSDAALTVCAIGFAGCFCAVATHITFNSLYSCIFVNNRLSRARVLVSSFFWLTSLANFAQYLPLGPFGCLFTAKLSVVVFHLQMLSGEAFQMYRISVITGRNKLFVGLATILLTLRAITAISDLVLSTSYAITDDPLKGQSCVFVQELYSGLIHVAMDAIVELFITTAITIALFKHTRELKRLQSRATNYNLYMVIVETNIFRTVILFLINLFTMIVIMYDPHAVVLTYMWSLMGIVYLYFVIYDKGMVRFLHQVAKGSSSNNNDHSFNNDSHQDPSMLTLHNPLSHLNSSNPHAPKEFKSNDLAATELSFDSIECINHAATVTKFTNPEANPTLIPTDDFPASIEDWANYYLTHIDKSSSARASLIDRPPLNISIV